MPRRRAQALVETALVFPLLVSVSVGLLQILLYAHAQTVVVTAVQEGARVAAEAGRTPDEGYQRAQDVVSAGLGGALDGFKLIVSADGDNVWVIGDGALHPLIPVPAEGALPVHAESHFARERFRPGDRGR